MLFYVVLHNMNQTSIELNNNDNILDSSYWLFMNKFLNLNHQNNQIFCIIPYIITNIQFNYVLFDVKMIFFRDILTTLQHSRVCCIRKYFHSSSIFLNKTYFIQIKQFCQNLIQNHFIYIIFTLASFSDCYLFCLNMSTFDKKISHV